MGKLREINGGVFREVDRLPDVGDFIVYDKAPAGMGKYLTAGELYEVIETGYHDENYILIEDDENEEYNAINDDFTALERASQAEVLQYLLDQRRAEVTGLEKRLEEAKQEEKWAKIGRKVNEFKVGDIVRYEYKSKNNNAIGRSGFSGILAEVDGVILDAPGLVHLVKPSFVDDRYDTWAKLGDVALIVPAESRTDR